MIKALINEYTENTYIINEKKDAYIIDPGTKIDEIKAYITEKDLRVLGILLTHGHFDHITAINDLLEEYGVNVYLHELEREFLFNPSLNLSSMTYHPFVVKKKSNVITFTKNHSFTLGRETITVLETPGHTKGGVCYQYKNVLFSGDTLFKNSIGRSDLPTSNGADLEASVQMLVTTLKDNTIVYPGHGPLTTILNEKHENPFIKR